MSKEKDMTSEYGESIIQKAFKTLRQVSILNDTAKKSADIKARKDEKPKERKC